MAYVTQAQLESRLGRELTSEEADYFDNVLSPAIDAYINDQTSTQFGSTDVVSVYVGGEGTSNLVIPTMYNVTEVAEVQDDGSDTVIPSANYVLYPNGNGADRPIFAVHMRSGSWDQGFSNYKVTGKLGYKLIPADIVGVALEAAFNNFQVNTNGAKSEKVGDWSITYDNVQQGLSGASISTLGSYNRLSRRI